MNIVIYRQEILHTDFSCRMSLFNAILETSKEKGKSRYYWCFPFVEMDGIPRVGGW